MLRRLSEISTTTAYKNAWLAEWAVRNRLQGFLTRRCSKEFLTLYLEMSPDLLNKVSEPGLFLDSVPEVDLAVRLHELGLLPEDRRKRFIATVSEYAVEGRDLYALENAGIRGIFKDFEFEELLVRVRRELLPRLDDVRWEWQSNRDSSQSPDEYMQPLLDSFETLKKHFGDDEEAAKLVEREARHAAEWIAEHMPEEPDIGRSRSLGGGQAPDTLQSDRSIFDDVDA